MRDTARLFEQIAARVGLASMERQRQRMRNNIVLEDIPFEPDADGLYRMKIAMPGKHGKGGKKGGKKGGGKKGGRRGY